MRFSKSTSRGLTKTGCVWESTKPGRTTWPAQSISRIFFRFVFTHGSRSASFVLPTETIFPPRHKTAPSSMTPSSLSSEPRRGPGRPEEDWSVSNCPMLASSNGRGVVLSAFRDEVTLSQFSSRIGRPDLQGVSDYWACSIIRQSGRELQNAVGTSRKTRRDHRTCKAAQAFWHRRRQHRNRRRD